MSRAPHPHRLALVVLALLLAGHSAAHFVAVARVVRSISPGLPLELFGGLVVTSNWAIEMLLATALAAVGTGFLISARLLVGWEATAGPLLIACAVVSLLLTVVGLWPTVGGLLVNIAVLTVAPGVSRLVNDQHSSVFF